MTPHEVFLRDIKRNPTDDGLRLVFADWLEERDDPRGEFVRLQVARFALAPDDPHYTGLMERERAFLAQYKEQWLGSLGRSHPEGSSWFFEGGTLHLKVEAGTALGLGKWSESEAFAWIETLHVWGVHSVQVDQLIEASWMRHVAAYNLWGQRLGPAVARALAANSHIDSLRLLNLGSNDLRSAGAAALASAGHLSSLQSLLLGSNNLREEGVAYLAASHFPDLMVLDLRDNAIGDLGARALAEAPSLERLARLDLRENRIGDDGRRRLTERFCDRVLY